MPGSGSGSRFTGHGASGSAPYRRPSRFDPMMREDEIGEDREDDGYGDLGSRHPLRRVQEEGKEEMLNLPSIKSLFGPAEHLHSASASASPLYHPPSLPTLAPPSPSSSPSTAPRTSRYSSMGSASTISSISIHNQDMSGWWSPDLDHSRERDRMGSIAASQSGRAHSYPMAMFMDDHDAKRRRSDQPTSLRDSEETARLRWQAQSRNASFPAIPGASPGSISSASGASHLRMLPPPISPSSAMMRGSISLSSSGFTVGSAGDTPDALRPFNPPRSASIVGSQLARSFADLSAVDRSSQSRSPSVGPSRPILPSPIPDSDRNRRPSMYPPGSHPSNSSISTSHSISEDLNTANMPLPFPTPSPLRSPAARPQAQTPESPSLTSPAGPSRRTSTTTSSTSRPHTSGAGSEGNSQNGSNSNSTASNQTVGRRRSVTRPPSPERPASLFRRSSLTEIIMARSGDSELAPSTHEQSGSFSRSAFSTAAFSEGGGTGSQPTGRGYTFRRESVQWSPTSVFARTSTTQDADSETSGRTRKRETSDEPKGKQKQTYAEITRGDEEMIESDIDTAEAARNPPAESREVSRMDTVEEVAEEVVTAGGMRGMAVLAESAGIVASARVPVNMERETQDSLSSASPPHQMGSRGPAPASANHLGSHQQESTSLTTVGEAEAEDDEEHDEDQDLSGRDDPAQGGSGQQGPKYACAYCAKTFSRPSSLRIHTYSHTGERPFICPEPSCRRRFSVQSNLKRHAKVHQVGNQASQHGGGGYAQIHPQTHTQPPDLHAHPPAPSQPYSQMHPQRNHHEPNPHHAQQNHPYGYGPGQGHTPFTTAHSPFTQTFQEQHIYHPDHGHMGYQGHQAQYQPPPHSQSHQRHHPQTHPHQYAHSHPHHPGMHQQYPPPPTQSGYYPHQPSHNHLHLHASSSSEGYPSSPLPGFAAPPNHAGAGPSHSPNQPFHSPPGYTGLQPLQPMHPRSQAENEAK